MTNYLSIDYGQKNIGIAYKIAENPIVPTDVIPFSNNQQLIKQIAKLCQQYQIQQIVIGLPLNLKGEIGHQSQITIEFKKQLVAQLNIPVTLADERFSSKIFSENELNDSYSAATILNHYLMHQKNKLSS